MKQQRTEALRIADDLGRIIETANAPIFGVDVQGRVTEWNRKLATLSHFSKEEALGKSLVQNFITEKFQESVGHVLLKALNGEQTASFELPLVKNGEQKAIVLLNATTRLGPEGEVIGVICVGQDITQITAMKEEQQRTADDLSRLIDSANAPIFGVDLNGMVTEWNRKAADMLGYTKNETIGKHLVQNFIQKEDRASVEEVLRKALAGLETANFSLPLVAKFGKRYTVLLNATTRRDAKGLITGVVGVGQDITELNKVLAESKRIADDLMRLIETANAPIFGIDNEGRVTEWNAKASSLLGFSKEEAMGKSLVQNFITEEFKESVNEVLNAALSGKDTANFEFPLFTKGGERREILLNATTRRGPNGEVIGVIGVGQDITRIREITKEQERIADDLSRLIESANAPIFGVDLDGMVTEWNKKAAEMLGYTKDETIGKHLVQSFIQPENRASVEGVLRRALSGEDTANYELPLLSKTQKRLTVLLNATTRRDSNGKIIGVVGVGQDISELNMLMADSQRVADDLTRLIETANAPIFGMNTDGEVTEWNRMMKNITEYTKEEAFGKNLIQTFISEEYRSGVQDVLNLALRGVDTANFEFPLFTKHLDRKIQILMSATPRRGPDGTVIGMIGVGQDITQLRAAKEQADRTAKELQRLVETANAPIFGVDQHCRITEWNQMMCKISGVSREEVFGSRLLGWLFDLNAQQSVETVLMDALNGQETGNFELRFNRRATSGQEAGQVVLLLSATPRLDSNGNITGVVSIGQDITEHKALEEKKMRFMAVVSHELRSPIHGICGLSEAMAVSERDQARQKQLNMIRNCSTRLLDLVTNIMDISSMRSKTLKLTKGPCNIAQIIDETVHLLQHATDKRSRPVIKDTVKMHNNIAEDSLPIIEADVHRCTQVFFNLIMNALKFTMKGHVNISATVDYKSNMINVAIEDTGIGVSAGHLERIFEPFEQEDDSEARTFEGIGLGLAISREVVRRHGGEIKVQSKVGVGSTFTVLLPIRSAEPLEDSNEAKPAVTESKVPKDEDAKHSRAQVKQPKTERRLPEVSAVTDPSSNNQWGRQVSTFASRTETIPHQQALTDSDDMDDKDSSECHEQDILRQMTVLVVDPSVMDQDVVKAALRPLGCTIITAADKSEVIRVCSPKGGGTATIPDLVVLDGSSAGHELCRYMQEDLQLTAARLPMIMVSAKLPREEAAVEAFACGATDFIAKPFDAEEIRCRIRSAVMLRLSFRTLTKSENRSYMLSSLMPKHVADKLINGDQTVAEQLPRVAVLFCTIVSWGNVAEALTVSQAVPLLNSLHVAFDNLSKSQGIFRVASYADSYMAVAGHDGSSNAEKLLKFALGMLQSTSRVQVPSPDLKLEVRIGLHVGPAMAGVLGRRRPRYCFFGETVTTASRLETSGVPGCIHLSEAAHDELRHIVSKQQLPLGASLVDRGMNGSMRSWLIVPAWMKDVAMKATPGDTQLATAGTFNDSKRFEVTPYNRGRIQAGNYHLLSVDDDDVNQEVVQGVFKPEGFSLSIAMDGVSCLKQIELAIEGKAPMPSVLLLDSMMPGMSGLEVCKKLRERFSLLDLAIIMLTCRSSPDDAAEALLAGCNDYVTKPFNRRELIARVHVQLSTNRCSAEKVVAAGQRNEALISTEKDDVPLPLQLPVQPDEEPSELKASTKRLALTSASVMHGQHYGASGGIADSRRPVQAADDSCVTSIHADNSALVDLLQSRVTYLRTEVSDLRKNFRLKEKENFGIRAELAAVKAESQHLWGQLVATEEELHSVKGDHENDTDQLVLAGIRTEPTSPIFPVQRQ